MLAVITRSPLLSSMPTRGVELAHFGDDDSDGKQPHVYLSWCVSWRQHTGPCSGCWGTHRQKMTLDTYADLFDDDLDAAAATLHARYSPESVFKMCSRPAMDDR
jgi:hypothetical protein